MATTPWMTSDDLLTSIKRKISFPTSQNTFTDNDLLGFANEEIMIGTVPQILSFHEEYFVARTVVPLVANQNNYPIPTRAIGMKLRGVFWCDSVNGPDPDPVTGIGGNLFEMTRLDSEDKAFFQANIGANRAVHKYYLEGNDVVLTPTLGATVTGSLVFYYFLRPNQLVTTDRAAIITQITIPVVVDHSQVNDGDTVTILGVAFTARTFPSTDTEFAIGSSSFDTHDNLITIVNSYFAGGSYYDAFNFDSSSGVLLNINLVSNTFKYSQLFSTSNPNGFHREDQANFTVTQLLNGSVLQQIPSNIAQHSKIDILQTLPGHKLLGSS